MNDEIIARIKERAATFVKDNYVNPLPQEYLIVENAMLIGASIVFEVEAEEFKKEA